MALDFFFFPPTLASSVLAGSSATSSRSGRFQLGFHFPGPNVIRGFTEIPRENPKKRRLAFFASRISPGEGDRRNFCDHTRQPDIEDQAIRGEGSRPDKEFLRRRENLRLPALAADQKLQRFTHRNIAVHNEHNGYASCQTTTRSQRSTLPSFYVPPGQRRIN